uniref:Uncharacterized protein n=1 Tax=Rhizophora mucronata TaxID=61149 RepID=A0A2P2QK76_RHIMU
MKCKTTELNWVHRN